MSLGERERRLLEGAVQQGRAVLERDFAAVLEGRFGIHPSGRVEDVSRLKLLDTYRAACEELQDVLAYLRASGVGPEAAVARLLREAVFTTLNRLVAVRVAEAIELLPESLGRGRDSRGFREFLEIFPLLGKDATGGYWTYLRLCADELSSDAPVLFDPRNPLLALEPSARTLDELVAILADPEMASIWRDPEAFGWTYQYFNTDEDRRAARETSAPRDTRELAVRNQWFTPRYVVDFLVHNTLGRRLVEAGYQLLEELDMLVDTPRATGHPLNLDAVRVLDPAVGSGHFLLGCYDLLERVWETKGVSPERAAGRIIPCLWGIDIDPRCAQVAAAALVLRVRRRCRDRDLPRPNIVTARPLPGDDAAWERVLRQVDGGLREAISRIHGELRDAPVLGPLLKVEEAIRSAIDRIAGLPAGGLFTEDYILGRYRDAERRVLAAIGKVAQEASSSAAERLFAAEATDALRFVEAMQERYDVVLLNPPFGEPVPETKAYLKAAYPWIPWKDYNLLAAFVGRGIELLRDGGYLGAITSRAGLFLTTFEAWRRDVLLSHRLLALADLGYGVMEGAMVEAAAYVVAQEHRRPNEPAVFLRLLKDTDRPAALPEACCHARKEKPSTRVFRVAPDELEDIPGAPLAYWVAPSIRRLFRELPPLEGNGAGVRQGLATADDFRFVRAFWEVDPARIGCSREETFQGKRWAPFAKGGEYSPYYADIHLVVDWEDDGRRIREFGKGRVQNTQYYFRPGLTWPLRTASGFGPRILPAGCIFSTGGNALFPKLESPHTQLGWLTTRLTVVCMAALLEVGEETESGTAATNFTIGKVSRLPWLGNALENDTSRLTEFSSVSSLLVPLRAAVDEADETTRRFACPAVLRNDGPSLKTRTATALEAYERAVIRGIGAAYESERILHDAIGLDEEAERYLDEEYGPHPASYPKNPLSPDEEREFTQLYQMPIDAVIDEAVKTRGGSRTIATKSYFLDRRLEVLAHVFRRHPSVLAETRSRLGLLPPEEPRRSAEDLVSYLVGCAFGRFDVRVGCDPSLALPIPDPSDPVPLCSPGMLTGPDGLPAREAPPDYPLELPPDRILVDDEGHRWDVVRRARAAAAVLFDDPDQILLEVEHVLGRPLREYLRRNFFKVHLDRYSKSRRRAPIYWHLSIPSREWAAWVYAPVLSRETLFAVLRESRKKERALWESLERLRRAVSSASGRDRKLLEKELEATEHLLSEVSEFRTEADRVANLGWDPDLDDGFVLCAAPLSKLFPAWRVAGRGDAKNPGDPKQARRMLKEGRFPWATVAKWKEKL